MKQFMLLVVIGAALAACNKPSEESCRKALLNMQRLLGTETLDSAPGALESEVRRCKGASTKKAVECAAKAETIEALAACDFVKGHRLPQHVSSPATGSAATGSAAGSAAAGSAAMGSAAAGSAAMGSAAAGSAAVGSAATGSAATGSAATGSAATGSAGSGAH